MCVLQIGINLFTLVFEVSDRHWFGKSGSRSDAAWTVEEEGWVRPEVDHIGSCPRLVGLVVLGASLPAESGLDVAICFFRST
jgi:hypothetical protein